MNTRFSALLVVVLLSLGLVSLALVAASAAQTAVLPTGGAASQVVAQSPVSFPDNQNKPPQPAPSYGQPPPGWENFHQPASAPRFTSSYRSSPAAAAPDPEAPWLRRPAGPAVAGDWDGYRVRYPFVMNDGGLYKMWYIGLDASGAGRLGYATSPDGITWTKYPGNPVLDLGAPGEFDSAYIEAPFVIKEGPSTYKLWYTGWGSSGCATGYATSSDGIAWTKYPGNPVLAPGGETWNNQCAGFPSILYEGGLYKMWLFTIGDDGSGAAPYMAYATSSDGIAWTWDPVNPLFGRDWEGWFWRPDVLNPTGQYQMWYSALTGDRSGIAYATSPDENSWNKFGIVLSGTLGAWDEGNAVDPTILFSGTSYNMWYDNNIAIGLATSTDGITWTKPLTQPVLERGEPGVFIDVNYAHDWVQAYTAPGATVFLTVADAGGVKGTVSGQADQYGYFYTWDWPWDPYNPDILPGDVVTAEVEGNTATVNPVGTIEGDLDREADTISGTIHAPWFNTVTVRCEVWAENGPGIEVPDVAGDGGSYFCDFAALGWDLQPGQDVAVRYVEPDGDTVINVFYVYDPQLWLRVNYGHDWIESIYESGHTVWLTVTNGSGEVKATATGETGLLPWWGNTTGFQTDYNVFWDGPRPDLEAGDWVFGSIDNTYDGQVLLGKIGGEIDLEADSISGPIVADWFTETLEVECHPWGAPGPAPMKYSTAEPDGSVPYFCQWDPLTEWDILAGQDIGVAYTGKDGHWVANALRVSAPHLWINTWADGNPGEGGTIALQVDYNNDGEAPAAGVVITSTLEGGLTYLGDTSGFPHTGTGAPGDPLVWQLGDLPRSNWSRQFEVFAQVTAAVSEALTHTVWIETGTPYYQGDPESKQSTWAGLVEPNDTHLNVGKWSWTWDPVPGGEYVYAINTCNNGSTGSSRLILTDTLPLSTTLVSWWGQYAGWAEVASGEALLVVSHPSISGGWCSEVYVRVRLDETAWPGMPISNTAIITAANDLEPWDNQATFWHNAGSPHDNLGVWPGWFWGQFVPGGEVYYEFMYGNTGNRSVADVTVTQTLPVSTSFVRAYYWDGYQEVPVTPTLVTKEYVVWRAGALDNGYSQFTTSILQVENDAEPGTVLTSTLAINRLEWEDRYDDNQGQWVNRVTSHGPDIRVDKQNYHWNWQGQLWHEIRMYNLGNERAEDVIVTDTFPLSTTLESWHIGHGPQMTITHDVETGQLIIWLDGLDPGETSSVDITLNLDQALVGEQGLTFTNQVHAPYPGDAYLQDNHDMVTAYTGPDVFAEQQLSDGEPRPGEVVTFTVSFGNHNLWPWDGDPNFGSHLTDTLPAGAEFITATAPWAPGEYWTPEVVSGNQVVWGWGPMWNNSNWTFDVAMRLPEDAQGGDLLTNQVEAYGDSPDDVEIDWENNRSQASLTVINPRFSIAKEYAGDLIAGTPVTYTLTITNLGNLADSGLIVNDPLPEDLTYLGGGDYDLLSGYVSWTLDNLDVGASGEVSFSGQLACTAGVTVVNDEYQVASSDEGVSSPMGEAVSFDILAPSLQAEASASASTVKPGEALTFTGTASTDGPALSFAWDFGDGNTATGEQASHAFNLPGTYTVTLTVTDSCGYSATAEVTVEVSQLAIYLPMITNGR